MKCYLCDYSLLEPTVASILNINRPLTKSLVAKFLIYFIERITIPFDSWSESITYTHFGKPLFPIDNYVSISYSQNYILIALSVFPIGVDLEHINVIDISDFEIVLSPSEMIEIQDDEQIFYRFWTQKESVSKLLGLGLNMNFAEILCSMQSHFVKYRENMYFSETRILDDVCVSFVASCPIPTFNILTGIYFEIVDDHSFL